ncbi:uncharacterized protein LOC129251298 [Anastrepha obliqua]|uniref:uncharacterized protein LOC129251298 n=1 Tax=Anastrepha obliqua TaxID=95512 RepID=UPI00240A90AE|nr:uncharacterized protein LOC129251298 [Anastrepha obliqua]
MPLRSRKVCDLKKKCRNAGLPVTGNKNQLIERLMDNSDNQTVVMQRLSTLEKTISDLVLQQKQKTTTSINFVPPISSSPVNVIGNMEKSAPTVTSTYTVIHPQVLPNAYNSQHSLWTTSQEPRNFLNRDTLPPPTFVPPTFVPPLTSAPYATYQNPSVPYIFDYVRAPPVVPNYYNPYENVRDIVELLPVFDPSSDRSLTPKQFVKRVENLRSVYGWRENTLLFAVQQKMRGSAKYWVDSLQDVFISGAEFVHKFLLNFPCIKNEADVHLKIAQAKRQNNESAQEFYYRMPALGSKGGLSDSSIARHIINGISDSDLRKKISNNYTHCQDLLNDIINFNIYNEVKTAPPKMVLKTNASIEKPLNRKSPATENQKPQTPLPLEKVKCYNCLKFGHYSVNCAEPQLKTIKVNGIETLAFVDPGSSRTLIRKTFTRKIGDVREQLTILKGFAGGQYANTEIVSAIIEVDGNNNPTIMPVIDDDFSCETVLLGRDVLCRAGNRLVIEQDQCRIEDINKIDVTNDLSVIDRQSLQQLLTQHADVFASNLSEISKCDVSKLSIELNINIPICLNPYRIPFAKRAILSEIVSELLSNNIIRPSESSYAALVVLVEKNNGEHRLCVDYRSLNKVTIKRPYPMPIMEEQFAQLAGNNFFTTLDLRTGYHQIEIDESSKKYTAFVTTDDHYEYNRMPFGLVNAPAVFQYMMDKIIAEMPRGEVLAYLDDVIIPSKTIDEALKRLSKNIKTLWTYNAHGQT